MGILALISAIPIGLSAFDIKADIYLWADHERYIENIGYDLLSMLTLIVLTWRIWIIIPDKKYKRYAFDYLIISILAVPAYFMFYSQYANLALMPLLAILIYRSYIINE